MVTSTMNTPTLEDLLGRNPDLAALPDTVQKVNKAIDAPDSSVADVARLISTDAGLTTRFLRTVNSPFYRLPAKVVDMEKAVSILGFRRTRDLVLATTVLERFAKNTTHLVRMREFFNHAFLCATYAEELARRLGVKTEGMFVAALIHNIGELVLWMALPEIMRQVAEQQRQQAAPGYLVEQQILGYDHATVGAALQRRWEFPPLLISVAGYHHQPDRSPAFRKEVAIVQLADVLAKTARAESSNEQHGIHFESEVWRELAPSAEILHATIVDVSDRTADAGPAPF
jgi:putative nucleotidyltransferase with HDIG domain